MKLATRQEIEAIWQEAQSKDLSKARTIASACAKAAHVIAESFAALGEHAAIGIIGQGNKGLCGLSALIELRRLGWLTTAYIVDYPSQGPLLAHFHRGDGETLYAAKDPKLTVLRQAIQDHPLVIDALMGTDTQPSPIKAKVLETAVNALREKRAYVVSLCFPSGVDPESGEVAQAHFTADLTIIPGAAGVGFARPEAIRTAGQIVQVPLGVETLKAWQSINKYLIDEKMAKGALNNAAFTGSRRLFIMAGSVNAPGQGLLAGEAAMRIGVPAITLGVPGELHPMLAGQFPEAEWVLLPHDLGVVNEDAVAVMEEALEGQNFSAALLGVKTGTDETIMPFWERLFTAQAYESHLGFVKSAITTKKAIKLPPLVLGSDAFQAIENSASLAKRLPSKSILLADKRFRRQREKPENAAARLAKAYKRMTVFYGEMIAIAEPKGRVGIIPYPQPYPPPNGTEAVLGGAIAALLANSLPPWEAATTGAWLFAAAFSRAANDIGWLPGTLPRDISRYFPNIIANL